jgi:hypothetical protein
MPSYLVESLLPRGAAGERLARERRAAEAAAELTRTGTRVEFRGSIHVPEDEICFFAFEAETGSDVAMAAHRAGLAPIRVVRAVSTLRIDPVADRRGRAHKPERIVQ